MDGRVRMTTALAFLGWACLTGGVVFALIGAVGMLRFPDVFSRMHAAGIIDTAAVGLVLIGLALHAPDWLVAAKLVLIVLFVFFTSPTATHALARAALNGGVKPLLAASNPAPEGEPPSKA